MGFRLRAASVRGPAHIESGLPNQDAVLLRQHRHGWLAAVSDGMGSRRNARTGSHAVCKSAWNSVRTLPFDCGNRAWVETLYRDWLASLVLSNVQPADAVATCLMAWGLPNGRFRLAQLGDGLILGHPTPAQGLVYRQSDAFGNETLGLGLSRSLDDWTFGEGELVGRGDWLVLMTDGIADDLGCIEGLVQSVVWDLRNRGARAARAALTADLIDWPTTHHRDDKTIAIVYRT